MFLKFNNPPQYTMPMSYRRKSNRREAKRLFPMAIACHKTIMTDNRFFYKRKFLF